MYISWMTWMIIFMIDSKKSWMTIKRMIKIIQISFRWQIKYNKSLKIEATKKSIDEILTVAIKFERNGRCWCGVW